MRAHLRHAWETTSASFWFLPLLMAVTAVALSWLMLRFDRFVSQGALVPGAWSLYQGSQEGAQALLSTIAGSMIGVAGTVFSITIAVLSFTSSTFGARLLRNFMQDRGTQVVLGVYVATYIYCLMVLRVIESSAPGAAPVPHGSVTLGILLAILCLTALIYFFHHVAALIQTSNVLANVSEDLDELIEEIMPAHMDRPMPQEGGAIAKRIAELFKDPFAVEATASGYVEIIDVKRLVSLATEHDLHIRLERGPGDFVIEGHAWAYVAPAKSRPANIVREINATMIVGPERTNSQGLAFALNQLVEIALRALSPGINDPFTAMSCIDWLGNALFKIAERNTPSPYHHDRHGYLRVITKPVTFEHLVGLAFDQIRVTGRSSVAVTIKLMETLTMLMAQVRRTEHKAALRTQAEATFRGIMATEPEGCDQDELRARYDALLEAAGALVPQEER